MSTQLQTSFEIIDDRASKLSLLERAHLELSNISEIIKFWSPEDEQSSYEVPAGAFAHQRAGES